MSAKQRGSTVEQNSNIEQLACVGPVRAMRFRRDTEVATISAIAQADLDTLMQVWSVGPVISRRIKGSAQGHVAKSEAKFKEQQWSRVPRVAVLAGQEAFEQLPDDQNAKDVLEKSLDLVNDWADEEFTPVDYEGSVRIGYCADGMGGKQIGFWLDRMNYSNHDLERQPFHTPWDKYKRFTDPMEFVDSEWKEQHGVTNIEEVPKGRMPEVAPMSSIPFTDKPNDVGLWMAPAERTNNMVEWADEVVVVLDGEYADNVRDSCEYRKTKCTTVFAEPDGTPGINIWEPEEDDTPDFVPDKDEQVTGGRGTYDGADLEEDDLWHEGTFDTDDGRMVNGRSNDLSHYDPGGKGAGKNEGRWG